MRSTSTHRGMVLALCATLFYGQVPVLAKLAFLHGVDGIAVVLARTGFIAASLAPFAWAARHQWQALWAQGPALLLQALATLCVSSGLILSVQFIPASLAVMIFFTAPLLVLLAAPLGEGTAPSARQLATALLGFAGLGLALGPSFQSLDARGLALAALAALGYALQFFSGRKLAGAAAPLPLAWVVHAAILPAVLALFALLPHTAAVPITTPGLIAMLAVCAVYLCGYGLHMASLRQADASKVVLFFNLEPVVTMAGAWAVLGEDLQANQLLGFALVLCALVMGALLARPSPAAKAAQGAA